MRYLVGFLFLACLGLGAALYVANLQRVAAGAERDALGARIETQNRAIKQWKKQAEEQKDRADFAAQRAARAKIITRTKVERLMAEPVPTACPQAVKWGAEKAALFGAEWEMGK